MRAVDAPFDAPMHPPGCHTGLEAVFTNSIFSTFLGGGRVCTDITLIYILYIINYASSERSSVAATMPNTTVQPERKPAFARQSVGQLPPPRPPRPSGIPSRIRALHLILDACAHPWSLHDSDPTSSLPMQCVSLPPELGLGLGRSMGTRKFT